MLFKGDYLPFSQNTESSQVNVTMTIDEGKSTDWSNYVRNRAGFAFGYIVYNPKKGKLLFQLVKYFVQIFLVPKVIHTGQNIW